MSVLVFIPLITSIICFLLANFIYFKGENNTLNRVAALICIFLTYLSFVEFEYRSSFSIKRAYFWFKLGSLFPFIFPLMFHIVLAFTRKLYVKKLKLLLIVIYIQALIITIMDITTNEFLKDISLRHWGWSYTISKSIFSYSLFAWIIIICLISLYFFYINYKYEKNYNIKQVSQYILVGLLIIICISIFTDLICPFIGISIPESFSISFLLGALIIGYAIWKFKPYVITPELASQNIISSMSDALFLVTPDGKIRKTNPATNKIIGFTEKELQDRPFDTLLIDKTFDDLLKTLEENKSIHDIETIFISKEGKEISISLSASAMRDNEGRIYGIVFIGRDLRERKLAEERLRELSLGDELTGLYNRRGFFEIARKRLKEAQLCKRSLFLLFADLDFLKLINDSWGHHEGDRALIDIARILKESFSQSDLIARLGGDEFAVFGFEDNKEEEKLIIQRLKKKLRVHNAKGNRPYKLSLTIGIAHYDPDNPISLEKLMINADKKMLYKKSKTKKLFFKYGR